MRKPCGDGSRERAARDRDRGIAAAGIAMTVRARNAQRAIARPSLDPRRCGRGWDGIPSAPRDGFAGPPGGVGPDVVTGRPAHGRAHRTRSWRRRNENDAAAVGGRPAA